MSVDDLSTIKKMLSDLRWIQASALVASGLSDSKQSQAYMRQITRMEQLLTDAIKKEVTK